MYEYTHTYTHTQIHRHTHHQQTPLTHSHAHHAHARTCAHTHAHTHTHTHVAQDQGRAEEALLLFSKSLSIESYCYDAHHTHLAAATLHCDIEGCFGDLGQMIVVSCFPLLKKFM